MKNTMTKEVKKFKINANYDFSGWATRVGLKCSDGRTIMKDAFKHDDGHTVPLVWNHQHNEPYNVLGHALLENRNEGVYAYCKFNDTEAGRNAKLLVKHGDVNALSIYANKLQHDGGNVLHGDIREVSLVLAGANPGAVIDSIIMHGEESEEDAIIYTGETISLYHSEEKPEEKEEEEKPMSENREKTVGDVFDTLTEEQKTVVYALIGQALEDAGNAGGDYDEEDEEVKHNVFDTDDMMNEEVLMHDAMNAIISDAKRCGSMKESYLQHAEDWGVDGLTYGLGNIGELFPEAKTVTGQTPVFVQRDMGWVQKVMSGVHHTPFSRIKSVFANITADEARAKGYTKGNRKVEEVFGLLKRTTPPCTVYKKQKLDRDDIIDITDFDVVAWLKSEMRMMLDEELARAFLLGDGRDGSSDDKINELCIRPVWTDDDLYTIKKDIDLTGIQNPTANDKAKQFIKTAIKARKDYKGTGNPTLFTTEDMLTDCLLIEDNMGRVLYESVDRLATVLRVKEIVTVPVMENQTRTDRQANRHNLMGIIINLNDYNVGADKGGAVNMFDDFDIDYNQQKYLIETRCSGALTIPYSAIVIEENIGVASNGEG